MLRKKSPSPTNGNYEFMLRHERVKLLERVLKQFDTRIFRTAQAMREVASCLSLAGQSYHDVVQCINNTNPQTPAGQAAYISFSSGLVENYGVSLRSAATLFSAEMKSIKEGEQYLAYNVGVHQTVLTRLQEVLKKVHKVRGLGDETQSAFKKLTAARSVVQKKETKYMRKGMPLTESKLYVKQSQKMERQEQNYQARLRTFDTEYESLMQRQLYITGHTMDDFLDANTVYLSHILKVLSCLAPHGAETIEKMVDSAAQLGECLGVAPADQIGSRLRMRDMDLLNSGDVSPVKVVDYTTPGKLFAAKSSRSCCSHNFTSYYENCRPTAPSADRAPPTTRVLDEEEGNESNKRCCPFDDVSPRQLMLNQTPLRAPVDLARSRQAENFGHLIVESSLSPPPQAPSFPVSVLPANSHAIESKSTCEGSGAVADAMKSTNSIRRALPASLVAKAGHRSRNARDVVKSDSTGKTPRGGAPFGYEFTPAVAPPTPSVTKCSERRPGGRTPDGTAALDAGRSTLRLDRARSAEPFGDDNIVSSREYTPRSSLQPITLFPLEFNEDCNSQKAPLRMSTSTTVVDRNEAQPRSRPNRNTCKNASTASAAKRGPHKYIVSAPPEEDMMTCSINTHLQGSEKSVHSPRGTLGHCPHPHQIRDPTERPLREAAMTYMTDPQAMPGGARSVSHQCVGEGFESESGGVTGRSQNVSTSYGPDSTVPTPQPCTW